MTEPRVSVFELVVSRGLQYHGMLKGGRIGGRQAAFVVEWAQYLADTGDTPGSAERFAVWANVSPRTAYYRLDEFRSLFPEHATPEPLAVYCPVKGVRGLPGSAARDTVTA